MITSFNEGTIDLGVGLTEGWINGLSTNESYGILGTYVSSPLRWAISASPTSKKSIDDLEGSRIGVSRIGSGSFVMAFVLAIQKQWRAFDFVKLDTFKNLRDGVNDGRADAFMWEYFTTKKYYDLNEIKYIGDIYTPWPSWCIAASKSMDKIVLKEVLETIDEGVKYFDENEDEGIEYIHTNLDYSKEDALAWRKTVTYPETVKSIDTNMVNETIKTLKKAGLMQNCSKGAQDMIISIA